MPRKNHFTVLLVGVAAFLCIVFVLAFRGQVHGTRDPSYQQVHVSADVLHGEATAQKLENATLKAELGHSAWKVLHTMMAKFPDTPTDEDSAALKSYIFLFARLYPCGDCARHFQQILKQFPPQVSSRKSAASWACYVHNEVNKSLNKPEFDCTKIGDFYDCGCGDDKKGSSAAPTGTEHFTPLTLEKEE